MVSTAPQGLLAPSGRREAAGRERRKRTGHPGPRPGRAPVKMRGMRRRWLKRLVSVPEYRRSSLTCADRLRFNLFDGSPRQGYTAHCRIDAMCSAWRTLAIVGAGPDGVSSGFGNGRDWYEARRAEKGTVVGHGGSFDRRCCVGRIGDPSAGWHRIRRNGTGVQVYPTRIPTGIQDQGVCLVEVQGATSTDRDPTMRSIASCGGTPEPKWSSSLQFGAASIPADLFGAGRGLLVVVRIYRLKGR